MSLTTEKVIAEQREIAPRRRRGFKTALATREGFEFSIMGIVIWAVVAGALLVAGFVGYTTVIPGIQDAAAKAALSDVVAAENLYLAQNGNGTLYAAKADLATAKLYTTSDASLVITATGTGTPATYTAYTAKIKSASGQFFTYNSATQLVTQSAT